MPLSDTKLLLAPCALESLTSPLEAISIRPIDDVFGVAKITVCAGLYPSGKLNIGLLKTFVELLAARPIK